MILACLGKVIQTGPDSTVRRPDKVELPSSPSNKMSLHTTKYVAGIRSLPGFWFVALALAIGFSTVSTASESDSRRRALLVGVSDYDQLPPERDLLGPANDIALMREVLIERGFAPSDILVLADGVAGASAPTREQILDAWRSLESTSSDGDFLFFYYAGHGSQQPAAGDDEIDGLDEIILPQDVGAWDGSIGSVKNAITDNEIARFLENLGSTGADTWVVFDACHSETLTRTLGQSSERLRYLDPTDLGIPAAKRPTRSLEQASQAIDTSYNREAAQGTLTAFFAAGSSEPTPELRLPTGHPDRRYHGLFSWSLAKALRARPAATYRDLANGLILDYAARNRRSPTPRFEGELEGLPFALPPARTNSWPALLAEDGRSYDLRAGVVHGLYPNSEIVLVDADGRTLPVTLDLEHAGIAYSRATVSERVGDLPAAAFVRVDAPAVSYRLAVCSDEASREATLGVVSQSPRLIIANGPECDVHVLRQADRYWVADAAGRLPAGTDLAKQVVSVGLNDPVALAGALDRVARVRGLLLAMGHTTESAVGLEFSAEVRRPTGEATHLAAGSVVDVKDGDRIEIAFRNTSDGPLDATILFIDSHHRIVPLWPSVRESNRLAAGAKAAWSSSIDTSVTSGREHIVILANRADPGSLAVDLRFLADVAPSLQTRAVQAPLARYLRDASFGAGPTRDTSTPPPADTQFEVLAWHAH